MLLTGCSSGSLEDKSFGDAGEIWKKHRIKGGEVDVEFKRELRGFLLVSLFIIVVPLILFPNDFGLSWSSTPLLHFLAESVWYALILSLTLQKPSLGQIIIYVSLTLGYRICLGVGFSGLLYLMLSQPFSLAIGLGVYQFTPAFLVQSLMSPFVIKSLLGGIMKNKTGTEQETTALRKNISDNISPPFPQGRSRLEKSTVIGASIGEKEIKLNRMDNLENIMHYIREYSGVKAVILVDDEGLLIAGDVSPDQDVESLASYARQLKETNDQLLKRIGEKSSERINIHTPARWISLNQIDRFLLAVIADNTTGELLSVRIIQSLATIKRFLTERYQENILKVAEE
jgi:predicted regulator of Ras-like GTPase activity (Roadblock/LC7/MglB family)